MSLVGMLLATLALQGSGGAPLRKSDLVRLLSGADMSSGELAQLVRRNCLTFDPTARDKNDLKVMGADPAMLAAVDDCARRTARGSNANRRAPPIARATPVRTTPPPAPVAPRQPPPPPAPPAVVASATRSAFVSGGGQRGTAGSQLPRPVVFEVRDSTGAVLARQTVSFTGINARVTPPTAATDALGQARAGVTLGERVGSATVIASVGAVERQVAFNVAAGPAAQLVVMCGQTSVTGHFAVRPDSIVLLRVAAQDGFANPTALLGLRAAVADARIFRVVGVTQDSVAGTVLLKPDQAGTTSLAVIANGMRQYLTVTVPPRAAPGKVDCR
ncbi:MAG TPA: Ig-like domain-containing protein [Gemmatimonadales bacterium]|jgi:hypothetical protein